MIENTKRRMKNYRMELDGIYTMKWSLFSQVHDVGAGIWLKVAVQVEVRRHYWFVGFPSHFVSVWIS